MRIFKGLFNFIVMMALSVCLMGWLSFNILGKTVLSPESNTRLLYETKFSNELVDGVLDKYNTDMGQLRFAEDDLMSFVNDSGEGVINYVFLESEVMPSVDVSFVKEYIEEVIEEESKNALDEKLDFAEFVTMLRQIPDGESVSGTTTNYFESVGIETSGEELDNVIAIFKDNKSETDEVIIQKIAQSIARDIIDIDSMETELSLQELFDKLMKKNPFTVMRSAMEMYNKDVNGYLLITIVLLALLIIITDFRISSSSAWFALALIVAIIPLQALRLADFFIDKDFLNMFDGLSSYTEFMMDAVMSKLNMYSIIVVVLIILLFAIGKIFGNKADSDEENEKKMSPSRFRLVRFAGFAVIFAGLYLNSNAAYEMNSNFYTEITGIEASDFDIGSIDLTLRDLLNIEYDF